MSRLLDNILFTKVNQSNKTFAPHFHNTYSIGITHKGIYKSINQNNTYDFYAYSTRVNNPNELHSGKSEAWDNYYFYPSVELMSNLYEEIFDEKKVPIFEKHIINDKLLYKKLNNLFFSLFKEKNSFLLESNFINALSYMIKKYSNTNKSINNDFNNKDIIKRSIELINDSIDYSLSLDNISEELNLSKYHFLRIFKKELGITPHQYILNLRVEKTRNLIEKGYSISNAAIQSGFNDQSHFNRNFKKIYDYSPVEILKNRKLFVHLYTKKD